MKAAISKSHHDAVSNYVKGLEVFRSEVLNASHEDILSGFNISGIGYNGKDSLYERLFTYLMHTEMFELSHRDGFNTILCRTPEGEGTEQKADFLREKWVLFIDEYVLKLSQYLEKCQVIEEPTVPQVKNEVEPIKTNKMKKLFSSVKSGTKAAGNFIKNTAVNSATGILSVTHFTAISVADGCEILECKLNKDVDPEQIRRERMLRTIEKQNAIKNMANALLDKEKEMEASILSIFKVNAVIDNASDAVITSN